MADLSCKGCGREYYLHHTKLPVREAGETLYCKCGAALYSYGKGTDNYRVEEVNEYRERQKMIQEELEKRPTCNCGLKMVPRTGPYGNFYGCAKFPDGCRKIVNR
ncbi:MULTISPECIES: hypothetical protein [unclassified Brevibacillus]|uniref:hypothetical protein n=1 Tax=unclassified Brevibacillus TaxID=2684853 RepID=UPI003561EC0A